MATQAQSVSLVISAPKIQQVQFRIVGTAPYMQARFSKKAMDAMMEKHMAGSTANKARKREQRDPEADYRGAMHISAEGWIGIPASSFRAAMISACRLVGFKMTLAKLSIFVQADGYDVVDGQPLVRIHGQPERVDMPTRNATGVFDIRIRPLWREWHADVRVLYDADQFTTQDVFNLLARVGMQVGIGEGRPDSRQSAGLGYGMFRIAEGENDV
jgi:hypothetical protein